MSASFRPLPLLSLPLVVLLHGCGLFADAPPLPPQTPPGPVEAYMISANPGDSTTIDDPNFGKNVRVTLENGFTSAKGEECKRASVLSGQKEAEVVVICRNSEGEWRMAPRVWGHGIGH
ncbi:DVU3141 family protein [Desulfovibrio sp. ZJ200]|uniref:DVU3141 family protein n=1 Tax=Desulfovibrio sp. ZJ200 TaxID=2709792 RepID=UPI0013EC599C|nr:DVU3141 family protein [Desulfovibrio sp. ZJ200]